MGKKFIVGAMAMFMAASGYTQIITNNYYDARILSQPVNGLSRFSAADVDGAFWWSPPYGFKDEKGKVIIPCRYTGAGDYSGGLIAVGLHKFWGFIDKKGNLIVPMKYSAAGNFSEGLAPVTYGNKLGFINISGEVVIPFRYCTDEMEKGLITSVGFSSGMSPVCLGAKNYQYIDKTGKQAISATFRYAGRFRNGLAIASIDSVMELSPMPKYNDYGDYVYDENYNIVYENFDTSWVNSYCLIDTKGQKVSEQYQVLDTLPYGLFLANRDTLYEVLGQGIRIRIRNPFSVCVDKNYIYADFTKVYDRKGKPVTNLKLQGKWGWVNFSDSHRPILRNDYIKYQYGRQPAGYWHWCNLATFQKNSESKGVDIIREFPDKYSIIQDPWAVRYGLTSPEGLVILPPEYSTIERLSDDRLAIARGDLCGMADFSGKSLLPDTFAWIHTAGFERIICADQFRYDNYEVVYQKMSLFDLNGKPAGVKYDEIKWLGSSVYRIKESEKYGVINKNGTVILAVQSDSVPVLVNGLIRYFSEGSWQWYDCSGNRMAPGSHYQWEQLNGIFFHSVFGEKEPVSGYCKFEIKDANQKPIIPDVFDSLYTDQDLVIVYGKSGCFLIPEKGNIAGPFRDIFIPSPEWERDYFIVNKGGSKECFKTAYDSLPILDAMTFEEMLVIVEYKWKYYKDGLTGIISRNGKTVLQPEYNSITLPLLALSGDGESTNLYRVNLQNPEGVTKARNCRLEETLPVIVQKGDSVGISSFFGEGFMLLPGEKYNLSENIFVSWKSNDQNVFFHSPAVGTFGPYQQLLQMADEREIVSYIANQGGRCDTFRIFNSDTLYMEDIYTGETEVRVVNTEDRYLWFTGGKFSILSGFGFPVNTDSYDEVKIFLMNYNRLGEEYMSGYFSLSNDKRAFHQNSLTRFEYPLMVRKEKLWGLVNRAGTEMTPIVYDSILYKSNPSGFLAFKGNQVFTLNCYFQPELLSELAPLPKSRIPLVLYGEQKGIVYIVNNDGIRDSSTTIYSGWESDLYTGEMYEFGYSLTKFYFKGGKNGMVNEYGGVIIPSMYDDIGIFCFNRPDTADVFSYTDSTGMESGSVLTTEPYVFLIKINGFYGVVDLLGKTVVPAEYNQIFLVREDEKRILVCRKGSEEKKFEL